MEKEVQEALEELDKKITVLQTIIEEQLNISIDYRSEVDKFIDDFLAKELL